MRTTTNAATPAAPLPRTPREAPAALTASADSGAELFTPAEAARRLNLSLRTLARSRAAGWGPAYVQLTPTRIAYRRQDLDQWTASRVVPGGR